MLLICKDIYYSYTTAVVWRLDGDCFVVYVIKQDFAVNISHFWRIIG